MKIVSIMENTAVDENLFTEDGFSLFVEYNGKNYLIDTGLSGKAVDNARRMRLPIDDISAVFLTHNHTAHTGGIDAIMKLNPDAEIYIRAGAKTEVFKKNGLFKQSVGSGRSFFKKYADNLILFNSFSEVCEGFYLASCENFDGKHINPDRTYFTLDEDSKRQVPFDFSDESFAVIFPKRRKADGLILIGGCFHCGAENMLETVQERWHGIPILAVIGGFHLSAANPKALNVPNEFAVSTARALESSGAEKVYACHCTGLKGFDVMDEILGDRIMYLGCGEALEF